MKNTNSNVSRKTRTRRRVLIVASVAAISLTAACGGNAKSDNASTSAGTLKIATNAQYPPYEYVDVKSNKMVGLDIDMAKAIAGELKMKPQFQNVSFDSIIPGVQSKRFDVGISGLGDTAEREKSLYMVSFLKFPDGILVNSSASPQPKTLADLCGLKAALVPGSSNTDVIKAQSKKCRAEGKKAITLDFYQGTSAMYNAVALGRADVALAPVAVAVAQADNSKGKLTAVTVPYDCGLEGIAVHKDNLKLAKSLVSSVNALIKNGKYASILKKRGLESLAMESAQINSAAKYSTTDCSLLP